MSSLLFVQEPVSCRSSDAERLLATALVEKGLILLCSFLAFRRIVFLLQCLISVTVYYSVYLRVDSVIIDFT